MTPTKPKPKQSDEDKRAKRREYYRKWRQKPENQARIVGYNSKYWRKKLQSTVSENNEQPVFCS